jgi:hypothetical protein
LTYAEGIPTDDQQEVTMAEHENSAEHTVAEHTHQDGCGHETVQHEDHVDFVHDGHKHAQHGDHYDEH